MYDCVGRLVLFPVLRLFLSHLHLLKTNSVTETFLTLEITIASPRKGVMATTGCSLRAQSKAQGLALGSLAGPWCADPGLDPRR